MPDISEPPDRALAERWKQGDPAAADTIVAMHYGEIRRFFINKAEDRFRSDLIQETFKRLQERRESFRGEASIRTFLFAIARNVLYEHLRKNYSGKLEFDPLSQSLHDIEAASPSHAVRELELHQALAEALRRIPATDQELLEFNYWAGLTPKELASILGVPVGTVRSRLFNARKKLRAVFDTKVLEEGSDEDRVLIESLRELGTLL